MKRKGVILIFLVYLLFGIYFINSAFGFMVLPEFLDKLDKLITLIGGTLILVGAVNYFRLSQRRKFYTS